MIARIEKELCNPVSVNGYCEVPGPLYHIYKVDEDGKKTFVKTVEKDIKEAAREAQRVIDIDVLEVAYKEKGPEAFSSVGVPENVVKDWKKFASNYMPSDEDLKKLAEIRDMLKKNKEYQEKFSETLKQKIYEDKNV